MKAVGQVAGLSLSRGQLLVARAKGGDDATQGKNLLGSGGNIPASMKKPPPRPELAPATISEADGVRYLHLGTPWVQGAMRIRKPLAIELEYVQRMMVWMLLRPSDKLGTGHAVQLGLGAGAITRYCHAVLRMRSTAWQ